MEFNKEIWLMNQNARILVFENFDLRRIRERYAFNRVAYCQ